MVEDTTQIVWEYVYGVKTALEKSNRYFPDYNYQFIKHLDSIVKYCTGTVQAGTYLYRGRIYTEIDKYEKINHPEKYKRLKFQRYDAKNSFVNLKNDWPEQGRMNAEGIHCLYTAKDADTCIKELNPGIHELISIAKIKVLEDLKVVNFSRSAAIGDNSYETDLSVYIQELITQGGYHAKDYIFPQYIAEYCKSKGYDGIAYRSRYCSRNDARESKGVNITIFNYEKCKPISSRLYTVDNISIKVRKL